MKLIALRLPDDVFEKAVKALRQLNTRKHSQVVSSLNLSMNAFIVNAILRYIENINETKDTK